MVEFLSMMDEETKQDIVRVYDAVTASLSLPKNIKVNLTILTKEEIKDLNSRTRGVDKVTDVLSYPYTNLKVGEKLNLEDYKFDVDPTDDLLLFGDVFICLERAKEQAEDYGHTLKREMCFLFCHSMLHLAGYDHMTPQDEKVMFDLQNKILNGLNITRTSFKSGFVTIIGDTNMGKSTLINTLVKEHVAIVSPKSETTRENIVGVYNDDNCQIVFLDTPGYHKHSAKIDAEMDKQISVAVEDTEIILMLISAKKPLVEQYNNIIKRVSSTAKKVLLINKIDEVKYEKLYPELAKLNEVLAVDEVLPISALTGKNCDVLLDIIKKYLPSYDHELRYYPVDEYTDKNLRHMCGEIIREKTLMLLDDEVPHGVHVVVTDYRESETPIAIFADLYCERDSHKAIIVGKNGDMIKQISTKSRIAIEKLVDAKVNLQLYVKVKPNWRNDEKAIKDFGLSVDDGE